MRKGLNRLLGHFSRNSSQREVEEELRFHVDMQMRDYESEGLPSLEAETRAHQRFGDFDRIKGQCVQIASRSSAGTTLLKIVFTFTFVAGVFIRSLALEYRVTRIGDLLIMIGVAGGLLVMSKKLGTRAFAPPPEPIRLGLQPKPEFTPRAFDENGRTPFERISEAD